MRKRQRKKKLVTHDAIIQVLEADPKELVKFINAIFGTKYDPETAIVKFLQNKLQQLIDSKNEAEGSMATDLRADTLFSINGVIYQIEVQTQHDKTMLFRLVEYQLNGLLANLSELKLDSKHKTDIPLPQMVIIAIDKSDQVPDFYEVEYTNAHTQEKLAQRFPVLKLWEQTIESLAQDGKKLMLPFLVNRYKAVFAKNPMNEQAARDFVKDNFEISTTLSQWYAENQVSHVALHEMKKSQTALIHGFLNEYIGKNNPARKEVEDMVIFEERRRRPSSGELLIEQGKAMMQPILNLLTKKNQALQSELESERSDKQALQSNNQTLQSNNQTLQSNNQTLQSELESERSDKQTMQKTMQKTIDELQAKLAKHEQKESS